MKIRSMAGAAGIAAAALLAASFVSFTAVVVVIVLLTVAVGIGWPFVMQVPAGKTLGAVLSLAGLAAVGLVLAAPDHALMEGFPAAVALGVGAVFLVQLLRGTGQSQRLESTLGAVAGVLAAASGAGWIAAAKLSAGSDGGMMPVAAAALLGGAVACALPLADRLAAVFSVVLGAAAGALTAALLNSVDPLAGAAVGLFCGGLTVAFRRLAGEAVGAGTAATPPGPLASYAASGAPVLALGSLVYFVDRLM